MSTSPEPSTSDIPPLTPPPTSVTHVGPVTKQSGATRRLDRIALVLARFHAKTAVVLIGVGILLIALGAAGAADGRIAGQVSLNQQFPYLISGGILGLALVVIGSALLIVQSARDDRRSLEGHLERLIEVQLATTPMTAATRSPDDATGLVLAGPGSYHRSDCRLIAGREGLPALTVAEARAQGLAPCRVCKPAAVAR
jgi:uncharacterized membrane protein